MSESRDRPPEELAHEVRRKADRMLRARSVNASFWSQLVHVGVLGWMFILPAVLFAAAGHMLGRATGRNGWAVAGVALGVLAGAYLVWRHVGPTLEEPRPPAGRGGPDEEGRTP